MSDITKLEQFAEVMGATFDELRQFGVTSKKTDSENLHAINEAGRIAKMQSRYLWDVGELLKKGSHVFCEVSDG